MFTNHRILRIVERIGCQYLFEFSSRDSERLVQRWVDMTKIIQHDRRFIKYKNNLKLLDKVTLCNKTGGIDFGDFVIISGDTLYHMGDDGTFFKPSPSPFI